MTHIAGSRTLGHTSRGVFEGFGSFSGADGGGGTGEAFTVDLGNGIIGVFDASGTLVAVREAARPAAPSPGPFTGITEGERQQIAQLDRQLAANIRMATADLAEKRRQFDISTGLSKQRLAAEIKIAERNLQNTRQLAQLDARTKLDIARMQDVTTRRGQALDIGARRAEFAAGALGNDAVRQAIFLLGGSGGTSPLEMAAQTFPQVTIPPEPQLASISSITQLPKLAGGGVLQPGEAAEVHDKEVVMNRGDGVMVVIPVTKSAQAGGVFPLADILSAPAAARETFSNVLGQAFSAAPRPAFGETGQPMEKLFGVDLKLPEQLAAVFTRLPLAVQNIIRSALAVRGINPQEFERRRLAATPEAAFSGLVGVR